jgi:hypothetical protein
VGHQFSLATLAMRRATDGGARGGGSPGSSGGSSKQPKEGDDRFLGRAGPKVLLGRTATAKTKEKWMGCQGAIGPKAKKAAETAFRF